MPRLLLRDSMIRSVLTLLVCCLPLVGCENDPAPPLASGEIGSAGGTVQVASGSAAGSAVMIPAGGLTETTLVAFYSDSARTQRGSTVVGEAVRVAPTGFELAGGREADYTFVFDPARLPFGTAVGDVTAVVRNGANETLRTLTPTAVDLVNGTVTCSDARLVSGWVVARSAYEIARYLPLDDGNRYEFDGGVALDVQLRDDEPNFPGESIWRLIFTQAFFARDGVYLEVDADSDDLLLRGQFDAPNGVAAEQEITAVPFPLLLAWEKVGNQRSEGYAYTGYEINEPNPPVMTYAGSGTIAVTVDQEVELDTPAGRFDPVIVVEFDSSFSDDRPASGMGSTRLWLARDVGPVQIQRGSGDPQPLLQASVGGVVVRGN